MTEPLTYGNWIRKKVLGLLGLSALLMGSLACLPLAPVIRAAAGILSVVLFASLLYPLYAYYMFAPHGGNMQEKIYRLIVDSLGEPAHGKVLDIGTGNGVLAIKLAQSNRLTQVIGVDYWGKNWEYSKSICENNVRKAGVWERVRFAKGDAAQLDFADGAFEGVVSNLTFHEVKSVQQKSDVVREALRVLKPGGRFAFVDYFYDRRYYGETAEFKVLLERLGLSRVSFKPLQETLTLPALLRHPKALGKVGIVYGQK